MIRAGAVRGALLALCLALLPVAPASAQVEVPALHAHVTDLTGTLTAEQTQALESRLAALEQRKGSQFLILMLPTTEPQTIEEYSLAVAEKNKIGRSKVDDGLLLLVAKDDHKARIEVGYGLEGPIPDAVASRVIREYLAPHFRQDDYAGGLDEASKVLEKLIDGEPLPEPMAPNPKDRKPSGFAFFLGIMIGTFSGVFGLKSAFLRRVGAIGLSAGLAWLIFTVPLALLLAAVGALLGTLSGTGRFSSGSGGYGGWGGGGGSSGGGGWSGGGGSFGGGGASGGW